MAQRLTGHFTAMEIGRQATFRPVRTALQEVDFTLVGNSPTRVRAHSA